MGVLDSLILSKLLPKPEQDEHKLCNSKRRRIGELKMVGTASNGRSGQVVSVLNPSIAGSEGGTMEFTREEVEALVNEKLKGKSKFNLKEKCENMSEYIKRLRACIKWFQELEEKYLLEHDKLLPALDLAELKCEETEAILRNKEEELNAVIVELSKNYTALQDRVAKEEAEKLAAVDLLTREEEAKLEIERLQVSLVEELAKAQRELQSVSQQLSSLGDMYKNLQEYNRSLQQYNGKLHTDLTNANETIRRGEQEKAAIVEKLSTLRGHNNLLQDQLASTKASEDEAVKQKDNLVNEITPLRGELPTVRADRDRQQLQLQSLSTEVETYKECSERSRLQLDTLSVKSTELEARCLSQSDQIRTLLEQVTAAENKLEGSDSSVVQTRTQFEEQKKLISELQIRVADAEFKLTEGENLRKKLHNTILELKGNIRVFCRVRPLLPDDVSDNEGKVVSYPTSAEALGRGIDLVQNGQKHSFSFDKVFMPDVLQEDVFVEISQLVQSALDGYKVCIFAYGQTGSGKTYTMMGKPGHPVEKGLIPRSLELVFKTRQSLQSQGWKYDMQVSMLEIYNETIRDLLSPNQSPLENGGEKQYAIKHDASGNTHVSDLTIVDVCSSKEVAFLLDRAAQSRPVGKTQMNEQSSQSHLVFTLRISGVNESTEQQVQGVLNLIDLAGSERLSKSGSSGDRFKETQAIDKSLSSLNDVIFALAKKDDHVPFRNSKLTYLLQPCLGSDSKTLMFVNIAPDPSSAGESISSLRFAARVNACEIGVPRRQTNNNVPRSSDSRLSFG